MKYSAKLKKKIVYFSLSAVMLLSSCIPTDIETSFSGTTSTDNFSKEITSNEDESSSSITDFSDTSFVSSEDSENSDDNDFSETSDESDKSDGSEASETSDNGSEVSDASEESDEPSEESSYEPSSEIVSEESSEEPDIDISEDGVTIESAGERFKDKFTDGEIISTENSYMSEFVNVTLKEITFEGKLYFVQDIYIKKIESFYVGFAGLKFGKKYNDYVLDMVEDYNQGGYNVVGAINGDYCGLDGKGVIIRNGVLYGTGIAQYTICVLYKNGVMKIIPKKDFDAKKELEKGAWHAWDFAPSFLDKNGSPIEKFTERTSISRSNPRTAIGYFEPGHYCFVTAGGRANEKSYGVSFKQIASFMSNLGCKIGYNLDGGQSAVMVFGNKITNEEYQGTGRRISDIVFINDFKKEEE